MYNHKNGVTLKKLDQDDLTLLLTLKEESWFGTHHLTIANNKDQIKWFESIGPNSLYLIASTYKEEKIGLFKIDNIDWISRSCDVGHDVFKEYRGKKYGYKVIEAGVDFCFELLNLHRQDTEVLENNLASMKTLKYAGFQQEGIRKKAVFKCGKYLDSITMGILKENWELLQRVKNYSNICNTSYNPKCNI
jgi:RimJ/RimL family protein N-acetyltransferase